MIDTDTACETVDARPTVRLAFIDGRQRLADYLNAWADGDPGRALRASSIDADGWQALHGDDGAAAFEQACRLRLPLVRLAPITAAHDALQMLPAEIARQLRAVPLLALRGCIAIAVQDASDADALAKLDFVSRYRVVPVLATASEIRDALTRFYDDAEDAEIAHQLGLDVRGTSYQGSPQDFERWAREKPVVKLIHGVIASAVYRRASDIHFRPGEHELELLFRVDDELIPVRKFLRSLAPALVSRIKVLGAMDLAEHRLPQDGRTTFTLDDGRTVDLRISVLPTVFGESVVVRLLDVEESLKMLDQIGLTAVDRQRIDDVMQMSHGMFLTTGPTGCGKSTTLYAMLLELRRERINILTVEDPVEFHIGGIQQMQVNRAAGFTFASALRNFLRHDPDVIMVGEIRDRETADIAMESALTGHLVLSTLHTNTAATSIARLLDLGAEAYLLRASLLAIMAQRLVRLNCVHCLAEENPPDHVREVLGVQPGEIFRAGQGCPRCNGTGFFRRTAVYELLRITAEQRRLIAPEAEADRIHEQALADGMRSITAAALELARDGRISLSEAFRVRAD